jgi:hypothetical protein
MILDRQAEDGELLSRGLTVRRRMIERLLARFRRAYPELTYSVAWQSRTINAQAWLGRQRRQVTLYGGLARHRGFGREGLAFVLAHETGHHLAGPPFDQHLPWLSSESRASEWAVVECLPVLFGAGETPRLLARARTQARGIGLAGL